MHNPFESYETLGRQTKRKETAPRHGPPIEAPDAQASILKIPVGLAPPTSALVSTGRMSARPAFSRIRTTSPAPRLREAVVSASAVRSHSVDLSDQGNRASAHLRDEKSLLKRISLAVSAPDTEANLERKHGEVLPACRPLLSTNPSTLLISCSYARQPFPPRDSRYPPVRALS